MTIKETIVVEGKDDKAAVLAAVDANIICTSGFGLNDEIIEKIRGAYNRTGIIIFTDPDHAGGNIRKRLLKLFPEAKEAFLTRSQAEKSGDIGVENAKADDIIKALESCCSERIASEKSITKKDMAELGLSGGEESSAKRAKLGALLGIGYANANAFLKRLNYMNISLEEIKQLIKQDT